MALTFICLIKTIISNKSNLKDQNFYLRLYLIKINHLNIHNVPLKTRILKKIQVECIYKKNLI